MRLNYHASCVHTRIVFKPIGLAHYYTSHARIFIPTFSKASADPRRTGRDPEHGSVNNFTRSKWLFCDATAVGF